MRLRKKRRRKEECDALTVRVSGDGEQSRAEGGGGSWRFFRRHAGSDYSRFHNLKAVK